MKKDKKKIDNTEEEAPEEEAADEQKNADSDESGDKSEKKSSKKDKPKNPEIEPIEMQLLRLRADFDNFRKRTVRERNELYQRANEDLMDEILPVLDHLDLALQAANEHGADDSFVHGVKLVAEQLMSTLGRFGLKPIDAEGSDFNHDLHEAVSYVPSKDVPANKILAQTRRGYSLGNKLLRATQVVVSSGAPANVEGDE